jgi:hypothetical protein
MRSTAKTTNTESGEEMKSKFRKQQSPEWKDKDVNVKTETSLLEVPGEERIMFSGWFAEVLMQDKKNNRPPRDVELWIFADGHTPRGRGRVVIAGKDFIFPLSQDFSSFLIVSRIIRNPNISVPPVGNITLYVDLYDKPKPKSVLDEEVKPNSD